MHRKYKNRHKILKALQNKYAQDYRPDIVVINEIELTFTELVTSTNLTEQQVYEQIDFLIKEQEVSENEDNFSSNYRITKKGTVAYFDSKYLCLGRKEWRTNIYDWIKTISTIVLLLIAIFSFALNIIDARKNETEIDKIKIELQKMKDSLSTIKP